MRITKGKLDRLYSYYTGTFIYDICNDIAATSSINQFRHIDIQYKRSTTGLKTFIHPYT